jgi:WD40 repeat protein
MIRRAAAALALVLLFAPLVQAAPTGARSPIDADSNVNDVAIGSGGRFAAAGDDPGSFLMGSPSEPTWHLWNLDGSLRQTGSVDPAGCPDRPDLGEDCQTRATRVAVSADGRRVAVAGQVGSGSSPGDALLGLFTDAGTATDNDYPIRLATTTINAIALSDDGNHLVVGGTKPVTGEPGNPSDGLLGSYNGAGKVFEATLPNPVTAVAVSSSGDLLAAAARYDIRAEPSGSGTLYENRRSDGTSAVQGNQVSVDVSDHARGWSVAGYDSGFFAVFSDAQGGPGTATTTSLQDYQKRESGDSSSLTAVAIRPDATAFVTGSSGGRLRLYTLDPTVNGEETAVQPALAATLDSQGAFVDIAFSGDGRYLAARAGGGIRFYDTRNGALSLLWSDDRSGLAPSVAIDGRGEHVVAAAGSSVIVYDAKHTLTPSFPSATQPPGPATTHRLTYRNDGNRVDAVQLRPNPPAGISVGLQPSTFTLKPGESQSVDATVTIPGTYPPGTLKVPIEARLNDAADGAPSTTLSLTVPSVRDVRLEPQGATSKGADGGAPALFTVLVANRGNTQESVALVAANVPAGWTASVDPASMALAPGAATNVTVSLAPPAGAHDGLAATIALQRDGGPATSAQLTATVGANFQVRLVVPAGTVLRPGAAGFVNATVRNDGNAMDSFVVRLGSLPAGWRGGFLNGLNEFQVDDVEPGGSRVVQASLQPAEGSASDVPIQVTLAASSLGDPSKTTTKGVLITVQEASSDTGSSTGSHRGSPAPAPALLATALAFAALALRRRR